MCLDYLMTGMMNTNDISVSEVVPSTSAIMLKTSEALIQIL